MSKLVCLEDYEAKAQSILKGNSWNYYSAVACTGKSSLNNLKGYNRYYKLPKVLRNVSNVDTSVTLLGQKIPFPIGISPTAHHVFAQPDGEVATARGCVKSGTCMIQSMLSNKSIEEVTEGCNGQGLRWMQVQPIRDRSQTVDIVRRAEKNGYKALIMTCDDPEIPHLYTVMKYGFEIPPNTGNVFGNLKANKDFADPDAHIACVTDDLFEPAQSWEWIDWLRSNTTLPIVLKGILRADDAVEALKHNIQGILVSNHGGRVLDDVPATIDVLPDIVQAVNGKVEVYIDGGIRHGTDVFKALALGAKAVFVGRPVLWGLACNGEDGVYDVLELLRKEFRSAMVFSGCSEVAEITSNYIINTSYYENRL